MSDGIKRDAGKRIILEIVLVLLSIGVLAYSLLKLGGKMYYLICVAMVLISIIFFMIQYERKEPKVTEIMLVAVLCSIGVVSRISLAFLPQVKPMAVFVIIAGVSMGPETGFFAGMLCAFVSNFYFGQGSWTPFQMFALGVVGFFAGIIFKSQDVKPWKVSLYGFLSIVILYGGIVDINTLYYMTGMSTKEALIAVYGAGLMFNVIYGLSTAALLFLLYKPIIKSIRRVMKKQDRISGID